MTNAEKTMREINNVCVDEFGVGFVAACPTTALWLASHILETTGKNVYRTISDIRASRGKGTAFPSFGSKLFETL